MQQNTKQFTNDIDSIKKVSLQHVTQKVIVGRAVCQLGISTAGTSTRNDFFFFPLAVAQLSPQRVVFIRQDRQEVQM